jgi:hypothetical protein
MVLFVHATPNKYAKLILRDGAIKSFDLTKNSGFGEGEEIMNSNMVYVTALFEYFKVAIPDSNNTYFFFDESIISENQISHYCNAWEWGNITNKCFKYNKSLNVKRNINLWKQSYKNFNKIENNPQKYIYGPLKNFESVYNETVFIDQISLSSLIGIYSPNAKWNHPLLMKSQKELKRFLNFHKILDVDINPQRNYFIPFSKYWKEETHERIQNDWLIWASKQKYESYEWKKWMKKYNNNFI